MDQNSWTMFRDDSECSSLKKWSSSLCSLIVRFSRSNDILIIALDIFLLMVVSFIFTRNKFVSTKLVMPSSQPQRFDLLLCVSSIFNGVLGFAYLAMAVWMIEGRFTGFPLLGSLVMFIQGFTWSLLNVVISAKKLRAARVASMKFCLILNFLFSGFLCVSSLWEAVSDEYVSVRLVLDVLSFPGAVLFLFCGLKEGIDPDINDDASYVPLPDEIVEDESENATPFAKAAMFSQMSFWWLNPLMKKGNEKILEDDDIPRLRHADQAKTCYLMYMEQLRKTKQKGSTNSPSMLSVLFFWKWKELAISGFFALIKVLTMSTGPLFLKAFIEIAQGKEAFKYEGYVLTFALFLTKCVESYSERQWNFGTRLIGIQVRSMLSAAIYQKQLRVSNSAKTSHSPGEIVNYVTADAYRIGEFPYWFHQIWATSLQLCLALTIVYYCVGLASVAALVTVILTVILSSPLVKLQHGFTSKLMVAQDRRLKAITEALTNMRVLKLYAWETHFKNVIDKLRKEEFQWISGVQWQKGYYLILFWSSPVLVPAATFWACYFFGIPLSAGDVFTFLASLRIVQEPVRLIPDVATVFIEAKVSLDRIARFLDAPELQNSNARQKHSGQELCQSVFIRCSEISWDTDPASKATLRNINLVIKPGDKVAICGEVGSGKSTLLAAVLGEVPKINGTVSE